MVTDVVESAAVVLQRIVRKGEIVVDALDLAQLSVLDLGKVVSGVAV